ncbi:MAG TPA: nucleotidyltransferase family protein [Deinococcales bacterium]|nr:nucleotidyltransferase family protein [Deinococcales bacterium]
MSFEELRAHREEILAIAARHGARNVRVFGSVARDEAGPESDVDFLVDFEQGRSLFDLGAMVLDLQDLLGRRVDVTTPGSLYVPARRSVLADARHI